MEPIRLYSPANHEELPEPETNTTEVVRAYLAYLRVRVARDDFDPDHYANIKYRLDLFVAQFRQPISKCRQRDVVQFVAANPQWKSAHTKKNAVTTIVGCFRWAADEEGGAMIDACPYKRVKAISAIPYEPRRPASSAEYVALMRSGSRPLRRALFFLRRTGARTKEMRELRWKCVILDVTSPFILIVKPKAFRRTGKSRKIGLDTATANWLRAMRRGASDEDFVFTNCDGTPWERRVFSRHLRRYAERIGLDEGAESRVSAYCLRHSYTVDAIEGGATTREIADQLGHSTTAMIDAVYGKHTRHREGHLGNVQKKILNCRPRHKR